MNGAMVGSVATGGQGLVQLGRGAVVWQPYMRLRDLKYELIRTPFEDPLQRLRHALGYFGRRRHPELHEIHSEPERIRTAVARVLDRASHAVDIGCHYGSLLSQLCRRAPAGRHVAFEAVPEKVRFLRRKFPEVDVRALALSDRAGRASFFIDENATGLSSLAAPRERRQRRIEVTSARLDDVLPRDRRFAFVKVDVEGAEILVFQGALEVLRRDRPLLLFECGPGGAKAFGHAPEDLHELLTATAGYLIFSLRDFLERGAPVDAPTFTTAVSVYPFQAFNWIAVPRERALEW
jgi:FkbM family methyltransferase